MKVYTVSAVKQAENELIQNGVSEEILIDRASSRIAEFLKNEDDIAFLCGGGNNGSDGLACALKLKDKKVTVFYGGNPNPINAKLLEQVKLIHETHPLYKYNGEGAVVVDCLLGTGLNRPLSGDFAQAVRIASYSKAKKVAVDVPSGIDDAGTSLGDTFSADVTLVMGAVKTSDVLGDALDFTGKIIACDIGLCPKKPATVITKSDVALEKRKRNSHKGNYGKVKIIGGSAKYVGAPLFASASCCMSGAGLTTMVVPSSQRIVYSQSAFDGMTLDFLPDDGDGNFVYSEVDAQRIMQNADVIVIGPGMGNTDATSKYVEYFITRFDGKLVIDADGLNVLAKNLNVLKTPRLSQIILTPHVGEFRRLCPKYTGDMEDVKEFAKEYGVTLTVKSATSIISDGNEIFINVTGTPAMSKGGSGDVLSGVVGAFFAVNTPIKAITLASYYFGLAGEIVEQNEGNQLSITPMDIISALPTAFRG